MKKILELTIKGHFDLIKDLSVLVSAYNNSNEETEIDLELIECFLIANKILYPTNYRKNSFVNHTDTHTLEVFEDEKLLLTIQEKEMYELNGDDLNGLFTSENEKEGVI